MVGEDNVAVGLRHVVAVAVIVLPLRGVLRRVIKTDLYSVVVSSGEGNSAAAAA